MLYGEQTITFAYFLTSALKQSVRFLKFFLFLYFSKIYNLIFIPFKNTWNVGEMW